MSVLNVTFPSGVSTYNVDSSSYAGEEIFFSGISMYKVVDSCSADYALLYLNAYGGWDVFAFPVGKRVDNFTQFDYYSLAAYKERQITEITPTWELTSGWLTDEQAAKFAYHLIPTSKAYLYTFAENDDYRPYGYPLSVLITDKKAEYKNKRHNNALVNYTITVQGSMDYSRR